MKFTKHQILAYVAIIVLYLLFAFTTKLPLLTLEMNKQTLAQSSGFGGIMFHILIISVIYFVAIYFIPFGDIFANLKSLREPIQDTMSKKFDYWLKSQLYPHEIEVEQHKLDIARIVKERKLLNIDVLRAQAELNKIEVETYINLLKGQAQSNLTNAEADTDKAKAKLLVEAVNFISKLPPFWQAYVIASIYGKATETPDDLEVRKDLHQILKDMKNEELQSMKEKNKFDRFKNEEKMKKEDK